MKKFFDAVKFGIFVLWGVFVYFSFYSEKTYYFDALDSIWVLVWNTSLAALIFGFFYFFKNKKILSLHILTLVLFSSVISTSFNFFKIDMSVVKGGSIIGSGSATVFVPNDEEIDETQVLFEENIPVSDTEYIFKQLPENLHQYFIRVGFFESILNLSTKVLSTFILSLFYFIFFTALGRRFFVKDNFLAFFTGAGVLSIIIFFLAQFGVFNIKVFSGLVLLGSLFLFKEIKEVGRFLLFQKVDFKNKNRLEIFTISLLVVLTGMLLVDLIRVVPIAWDDATLYMRAAKLLATEGVFTTGVGPLAFTNLYSIGWLYSDVSLTSLALLLTVVVSGLFVVYSIASRFLNTTNALLSTLFLLVIPCVTYFSTIDTKVELPLLFSGAAALLAWLKWRETKEKSYFYIAAFLCAFTVTIKITAIIFAFILLLATIYFETKNKFLATALYLLGLAYFAFTNQMQTLIAFELQSELFGKILISIALILLIISFFKEKFDYKKLGKPVIFCGFIFLLLLPWVIMNLKYFGYSSFENLLIGAKENINFLHEDFFPQYNESLSFVADYKRYTGMGYGFLGLIKMPWEITMTYSLDGFIADISPIFLTFALLWILYPKKYFSGQNKVKTLLIFFLAYFALWYFTASGVFWYGIFMILPLLIFVFLPAEKENGYKKFILFMFILISFTASFLLRNYMFAEKFTLAYIFGIYDKHELQEAFYPGFAEVAKMIEDYEKEKGEVILYKVGSQIKFFLPIPDQNILEDDFLDNFSSIYVDKTVEEIKVAFVKAGFTHVFLHRGSMLTDELYKAVYAKKLEQLDDFLENSGWEIKYYDHGLVLLEITQ